MSNPLVSIVVLNWNGEKHVHTCLRHVAHQTYAPIELIIVDNNSKDGSIEKIKNNYPHARYIENRENKGYSAGMNQGIAAANGEYVVLLNQDAALDSNFVSQCLSAILKHGDVGVVGARVFAWVEDRLTDRLRNGEGERFFFRKRFQGLCGDKADGEMYVLAPSGSFPFFKKRALEEIKAASGHYYDESYVTGWEDVDIAFRLQLKGWKCFFYPDAFGWHVGSGSVGGNATFFTKKVDYRTRILRNRLYTIIKNLPADVLIWLAPYLVLTELALVPYFIVKSPSSLVSLLAAWGEVLAGLSVLLEKRAKVQKNISVPRGYLKQFFLRF